MTIVNTSELLDKIAQLTTALTRQQHAASFSITSNDISLDFLCRASTDAECHYYADCYCDFPLHVTTHRVVQQRKCYLDDIFMNMQSNIVYEGKDAMRFLYLSQWLLLPSIPRTSFIKIRVQNETVFWSWLELTDLEQQLTSA